MLKCSASLSRIYCSAHSCFLQSKCIIFFWWCSVFLEDINLCELTRPLWRSDEVLWWLSAGQSTDKPCQWQSNLTCPRCALFFRVISWFSSLSLSLWWSLYGYPIILICFNVTMKAKVTTGLWWSVVDFFQFTHAYNYVTV